MILDCSETSQPPRASAADESQPYLAPAKLILAISADELSRLPSLKTVDVHADWLMRVYGPRSTRLPPTPARDVSELRSVKTELEAAIATHLRIENGRWRNRAWHASDRLRQAIATAKEQCPGISNLDWVSVEPRPATHSFAGSRMTGGSEFQHGHDGQPSYTDYAAAIGYSKYRSLLPDDIKRRNWLEEGSEIASAPPLSE